MGQGSPYYSSYADFHIPPTLSDPLHDDSYNRALSLSTSADASPLVVPGGGTWQGSPYYSSHADLHIPPTSSDLCYDDSYNRALPSTGSAEASLPLSLVPGDGVWQGPPYYLSHADLHMSPTSSDLRSPHFVYSLASSPPQYQSPSNPAYSTGHSPSRGTVPTVAPANTHYQRSMATSLVSLDRAIPGSRGTSRLPYARVPTGPPPVPYDALPETPGRTVKKKHKRADARQVEVLNKVYARTAFPSAKERKQLAKYLDMSPRQVQIWLAHLFTPHV